MNLPRWIDSARSQMPAIRALTSTRARTIVIFIAIALCLATFGPALAGAAGFNVPDLEAFVFRTCGPFCHQAPSRTFRIAGHALPLCSRCTGMWIGITLGIAIGVMGAWKRRWSLGISAATIAFVLSGLDHLREESGRPGWPWVRFGLGLLMFLGVTLAVSFDTLASLLAGARMVKRKVTRREG